MNGSDGFDAYAVSSRLGPHVTLQAGVVHLGRHWTTTTRGSVKARSIRRTGRAGATIVEGARCRLIGGEAAVLDPARPWSLATDPVATTLAGGALVRLGLGRLDQLVGYAEAGSAVPVSFLPIGRVLLVTRLRNELVLAGHEVVSASGRWDRRSIEPEPVVRAAGVREPEAAWAGTPDEIAALAARPGPAVLGVGTATGPVAVPATWDPLTGRVQVSRPALAAVGAELPGRACVTIHDSGSRRPDEKLGVLLRGSGALVDVDGSTASVAVAVERVTYWRGFATKTTGHAA